MLEVSYESPCWVIKIDPFDETEWQTRHPLWSLVVDPATSTGSVCPSLIASVAPPKFVLGPSAPL